MESLDKVLDFVEKLGTKIGKTVEQLWPHVVKYIAIDALVNIISVGGSTLISWIVFFSTHNPMIHRAIPNYNEINPDITFPYLTIHGWSLVGSLIFSVWLAFAIQYSLPILLEPIGKAVKDILNNIENHDA